MYIVISFSLFCVLFTFLESIGVLRKGMKIGFFLTTFLLAINYDYGNDYMNYYNIYKDVSLIPFNLKSVLDGDIYHETGWVLLNYLFKPIGGFFMLIAFLSVCQNIIVYKYIRRYVDKKWWPFAVSIYLFNTSLYILSFSTIRQFLVMCVFLWLFPYIKTRKLWVSVVVIFLSSFIHSSAIILYPFLFVSFLPLNKMKYIAMIMLIFFLILSMGGQHLYDIFTQFMVIEEFSNYADVYSERRGATLWGIGFIINLIPFILSIFYLIKNKDNNRVNDQKICIMIGCISYIILPFSTIIQLISRISYYFVIYQILSLPQVYQFVYNKNKLIGVTCIFLYFIIMIYSYVMFFNEGAFSVYYSREFKTIFSQI